MTLVSAANLQRAWDLYEESLQDTCQIKAATDTSDGDGGYTQSWPSVTATVSCAVLDLQSGTSGSGGAIDIMASERSKQIMLPRGTSINPSDRVVWSTKTFEVVSVATAGTYGPAVQCIGVELA